MPRLPTPKLSSLPPWQGNWVRVSSGATGCRPGPLGSRHKDLQTLPRDQSSGPGKSLTTNRQVESRRMCGWGSWVGGGRGLWALLLSAAPSLCPTYRCGAE